MAGVAAVEDVLSGSNDVAEAHVELRAVAVDVAERTGRLDGEAHAAGVAAGMGTAAGPPVVAEVGDTHDGAVGEGVDGCAFGDEDVDGRVVVVRIIEVPPLAAGDLSAQAERRRDVIDKISVIPDLGD